MAIRRIKNTISSYNQPLKLGFFNSFVITPFAHYNSVVTKLDRKSPQYDIKVSAKFDSTDFDGIHIISYLEKSNREIISSRNCTFNIYYIDTADTWAETLLYTTTGTQQTNGSFKANITQANLGSLNEIDGERTLAIECILYRFNKKYRKKIYVNHLGIYDSLIRLKQEVEWLDISKLDE